jgi:pimeloyl-ACP methyl ester carboxylesterase
MAGLEDRFRVVALDQRGYNLSDKPPGVDAYWMPLQVSDVAAVIRDAGEESATVVGHDLGGMVAWYFALNMPQMTDNLVVLNLPHPRGFERELAINPVQRRNSAYARRFQEGSPSDPDIFFGGPMNAQTLSGWVTDAAARPRYVEAFERSDFAAMLNFYKANYPALAPAGTSVLEPDTPRLDMPVLVFHGLPDPYLNSNGLNNTWDWVDADLTIVTVPGATHFVQHGAAELVTSTLRSWLIARTGM